MSGIYVWAQAAKRSTSEQRIILDGTSTDFSHIGIHTITLPPRQAPPVTHTHDEELNIMKEGKLMTNIAGKLKTLGAGIITLFMPEEEHCFENELQSTIPYAIQNMSRGSCPYFAFQFE